MDGEAGLNPAEWTYGAGYYPAELPRKKGSEGDLAAFFANKFAYIKKKCPNVCICAIFVVPLHPILNWQIIGL